MASCLKDTMPMRMTMEGTVNGYEFKCEGVGEGNPFEGTQTMKVRVTEGGPLPFAHDILSTSSQYGSKSFIKHEGIPDYFKQSLPEGFTWERTTVYEDGGYLTATQETRMNEEGWLVYKVKVIGSNFPADGPVMQNITKGWYPSTEILYPCDGLLNGLSLMALRYGDDKILTCYLRSTYRSRKAVKDLEMPGVHFTDHRIEMLDSSPNGYDQYEVAEARYSSANPSKLGYQ